MARHTKDIGIISITTIKLAKGMPESKVRKRERRAGGVRGLVRESKGSAVLEKSFLAESIAYFCAQTHRHALTHAHCLSALNVSVYVQREKRRDNKWDRDKEVERDRHSRTFSLPSHMYEISRFAWDLLECACVCMCECMRMCVCACVSAWGYYHISCSTWAYFTCQCRFLCCYWKSKLDVCPTSWQFHWQTHKLRDR